MSRQHQILRAVGAGLGGLLLLLLALPVIALATSTTFGDVWSAAGTDLFTDALLVSFKTSVIAMAILVVAGTPLAWWLGTTDSAVSRVAAALVELPVVLPPAVIGVALIMTFSDDGILGGLQWLGVSFSFSSAAVVVAQLVVAAPFYVVGAANAFRDIDHDLLVVAETLGAPRLIAIRDVALPVALPGLAAAASLAWARALGEFGATLLFAGSAAGVTQTMPLAIYEALETDISIAIALALSLTAVALVLLSTTRLAGSISRRRR